jgi:ketosteroid isomerase-like protein
VSETAAGKTERTTRRIYTTIYELDSADAIATPEFRAMRGWSVCAACPLAHAGDRAGPGRDTMTTGPTPALMKQINEAFNSGDVDRIMSFFAEDGTFLMARGPKPEGRRVHGKAAVRKVLGDRFRVITDVRWDHVDSFITGNRAVTVWMVTGTGVDGEKLNYRGCDLYEFRGDKVLNKDTYWKLV